MEVSAQTIAAIATPPGSGAIGVIRVSGPLSLHIGQSVFRPVKGKSLSETPHRMRLGWIAEQGNDLDQVSVCYYPAPLSYTGEEMLEIFTHGGEALMGAVLELVIGLGARPADPGEFTRRAFLNQKLDLSQAEAVSWLIEASSAAEAKLAARQLKGFLGDSFRVLYHQALKLRAAVEVTLDFEEYEGVQVPYPEIKEGLNKLKQELSQLLIRTEEGDRARFGLRVVIVGSPNAGKSSILNRLLGWDRAIVSRIPGTTRDIVEDDLILNGVRLRLVDTAGIRLTPDEIEAEGIRRARDQVREADLILVVLDGSGPMNSNDLEVCRLARKGRVMVLLNKQDQGCQLQLKEVKKHFPGKAVIALSAQEGGGFERLRESLEEFVRDRTGLCGSAIMVGTRRRREMNLALESIENSYQAIEKGLSPDILALELEGVVKFLSTLASEGSPEDLLDEIFADFCVGK